MVPVLSFQNIQIFKRGLISAEINFVSRLFPPLKFRHFIRIKKFPKSIEKKKKWHMLHRFSLVPFKLFNWRDANMVGMRIITIFHCQKHFQVNNNNNKKE